MKLNLEKLHMTNELIRDRIPDWYSDNSNPSYGVHEAIQHNNPGQYIEHIIEYIANYWNINPDSISVRQWIRFRRIIQNSIQQAEAEYLGI